MLPTIAASNKMGLPRAYVHFPQLRYLVRSPMAKLYGVASKEEAAEHLAHPVLGKQLTECVELPLAQPNSDVRDLFGSTHGEKLRSCLTRFSTVSLESWFKLALERFFST